MQHWKAAARKFMHHEKARAAHPADALLMTPNPGEPSVFLMSRQRVQHSICRKPNGLYVAVIFAETQADQLSCGSIGRDCGEHMLDDQTLNDHPMVVPGRKKRGGRKRGSKNKRTVQREKALATIKANGADPLTFFGDLLRNEDAPFDLRFQAAKELAPYVHPRLQSVESRPGQMSHEDRLDMLRKMLADRDAGD